MRSSARSWHGWPGWWSRAASTWCWDANDGGRRASAGRPRARRLRLVAAGFRQAGRSWPSLRLWHGNRPGRGYRGGRRGPRVRWPIPRLPCVLPATLTLIEKKEGMTKAWADASGGVLGALGLGAVACTALLLLRWNPAGALLLALVAWAFVSAGLYFLFRVTGLFLRQDRLVSKAGS